MAFDEARTNKRVHKDAKKAPEGDPKKISDGGESWAEGTAEGSGTSSQNHKFAEWIGVKWMKYKGHNVYLIHGL